MPTKPVDPAARSLLVPLAALALVAGCKRVSEDTLAGKSAPVPASSAPAPLAAAAPAPVAATSSVIKHVFVIAMENRDAAEIYGDTADAPYIDGTLMAQYARAASFRDELPLPIPSEPHYLWIEGGTNAFSDHTFTNDAPPSEENSTSSTSHLVTQIRGSSRGVTWRSYQEGLDESTGACPIHDSGLYAPKHDPFVFFRDVSGDPPSASNAYCAAHHRAYARLAADLSAGDVASYTFITPDLCHDMHGALECMVDLVRKGDDWLKSELPRVVGYADANAGVVFIEWDEGGSSAVMPFFAVGPGVKRGYAGSVPYDHSSILKSVDEILELPVLATVASAHDLADLFRPGQFP